MSLTEFLLARIAEDEAALNGEIDGERILRLYCDDPAHWSDRRTLAECEAKRRIVEMAEGYDFYPTDPILGALAQPYADHPGFQQEWAM